MLSPTRFNASVARHVVHKTKRWALRIAEFNFTVECVSGEHNQWADILTRRAAPNTSALHARRASLLRDLLIAEEGPDLPTNNAIAKCREDTPPSGNHSFKMVKDSRLEL